MNCPKCSNKLRYVPDPLVPGNHVLYCFVCAWERDAVRRGDDVYLVVPPHGQREDATYQLVGTLAPRKEA